MEIRLYSMFVKRANSTKQPTDSYVTKQCRQKEETSMMAPTFLLSTYDPGYNYVYVPRWGRYYFINDVTLNIAGTFEISCTFDALASYKNSIGALTTFVERTSDVSKIDAYMRDSAVSCDDRVSSTESATTDSGLASGFVYIMRILGRGSTGGIGTFVIGNIYNLRNLFSSMWAAIDTSSITATLNTIASLYAEDPAQYIIGVYASPIGVSTYAQYVSSERVYCGGHDTGLDLDRINVGPVYVRQQKVLNKPVNMYSDFRRTDPAFSQYTMYIPTIGCVSLPAEIMDKTLTMDVVADLYSGDLCFMLYADGDLTATYNSNCYSSMSVGVQNGTAGAQLITNTVGTLSGVATGNIVGAGINTIQGMKNILNPPASVIGTQGSTGCVTAQPDIVITCLQKSSGDIPNSVYGRPCCKNLLLSTISGYIKCSNASIDNIAGTDRDKELVNNFLNNGFYME